MDDGGREHLPRAGLSAPPGPGGLERRRASGRHGRWQTVGADIDPDARVASLSRTEKSLVAISRALAAEAELLVLDEPTASLPANEVARLFASLRRLRARGVGMIYVSHRLDEVFEIADRIVVLRDGRIVGERATAGTSAGGSHPADRRPRAVAGVSPARAAHRRGAAGTAGLTVGDVGPIDCQLHAGEIVGLVGLRGAGQESVGRRCSAGAARPAGASCWTAGRSRRPRRARRCGRASIWSAPTAWRTRWCRT